ncbi:hypothetical protein NUU61_003175 [Penicillium alfredii]|uniref:Uncharacterized protein n=1 Tax=Penicillium alfredii TaxID=1506179 RepID=A0A9W9FT21_9EURO|nr:uncharacterized protein NUU61_003175 [Penicillium alfredii]KAJ5105828.1 hypothetical protein NUU61_003175 [Penicillium alfredii]
MASVPNVYSAEPALPVLAHSLLTEKNGAAAETSQPSDEPTNWSLKADWERGIRSSNDSIFRCGAVVGFSRLRSSKDSNEYIGQIPRYLLTTHLRKVLPSSEPTAFIVHPGSFDAFAPRTLLNELLSSSPNQPGLSKEDAIHRLDSVQLLPVYNFPGAAQAIGKVSDVLQEIQERRESNQLSGDSAHPIILIVLGLDSLAEGVIRASNPVKGTALLTATLRTLTRVSRAHASCLSVLLVNTNGIGPFHSEADGKAESTRSLPIPYGDAPKPTREDGIRSIFHTAGPSLLSNLLMKTLDQGIDTHLLLSDVKGSPVVEVIKDRVGTGLGKWEIWGRQH